MSLLTDSPFELIIHPHDSRFWVWQHVADPEVVAACIMHSQTSDVVDAELLTAANPDLKTISTFSVGYGMCEAEILGLMSDHIDLEGCKKKGIRLGHTPGVLSDAVADVAVMLVLMTMRRVEEGIALVKSGGVSVLLHRNCKSPFGTAVAVWFPSIEASLAPFQLALRLRRADVHRGPPSPGPPLRDVRSRHLPPLPNTLLPRLWPDLSQSALTSPQLHLQISHSHHHLHLLPRPAESIRHRCGLLPYLRRHRQAGRGG